MFGSAYAFFNIFEENVLNILITDLYFNYVAKYSEKAMAPHSSTLAWKIPWMEEPGRLLRVRHD